jgi:hypothetical protein
MAAWGSTCACLDAACTRKLPWGVGPDARPGQQPRYTRVVGNLVREVGLIQKQSSMWFQAATALSHLEGNVHFNGPCVTTAPPLRCDASLRFCRNSNFGRTTDG